MTSINYEQQIEHYHKMKLIKNYLFFNSLFLMKSLVFYTSINCGFKI